MALTKAYEVRIPATADTVDTSNPVAGSVTCPVGSGMLSIMLHVAGNAARGGGAPTFNGTTMTQRDTVRGNATGYEAGLECWDLENPPTGSAYTLSVPNTGGVGIWIDVIAIDGGSDDVQYDTAAGEEAGGTGTDRTVSITTGVDGCLIFNGLSTGDNSWSPTGQTGTVVNSISDCGSYGGSAQTYVKASAGAQDMAWTGDTTGDDVAMIAVSYKPVSSGATLTVADAYSTSQVDAAGALTQAHNLTGVADAASTTQTDPVALVQAHVLQGVADGFSTSQVDAPVLSVIADTTLTVADAASTTQADSANPTQVHNLIVSDGASTTQADAANPTQVHNLTVADAAVVTQSDNVSLSGAAVLVVADAYSTTQADAANPVQAHNLTVADAASTTQADAVTLAAAGSLVVQHAYSTTQADEVNPTQVHNLIAADAYSTTQSDNVVLEYSADTTLTVQDVYSTTQADAAVLTQAHLLTANDAYSTTQTDPVVPIQAHVLVATDSYSGTFLDGVVVTQSAPVTPFITLTARSRNLTLTAQSRGTSLTAEARGGVSEMVQLHDESGDVLLMENNDALETEDSQTTSSPLTAQARTMTLTAGARVLELTAQER